MKDVLISDILVYYWMYTTIKITELLKGWRTVKTVSKTNEPFKFTKLLYKMKSWT